MRRLADLGDPPCLSNPLADLRVKERETRDTRETRLAPC